MISFLPKDGAFFELFRKQGEVVCRCTELFEEFAHNFSDVESYIARSKALGREGRAIVRELTYELQRSFNTPLDREDIHPLMISLDKIVGLINRAIREVYMYGITEKPLVMDAFLPLMRDASTQLSRLLVVIEGRKYIPELANVVEQIRAIESSADVLYTNSIRGLFTSDPSSVTVLGALKTNRFITNLEKIVDAFQTAANNIEGIAIKWS